MEKKINIAELLKDCPTGSVLISIGILLVFVGIVSILSKNPTALDVYQGKTTLEITYRDSIPVDIVVVFKDEFKK